MATSMSVSFQKWLCIIFHSIVVGHCLQFNYDQGFDGLNNINLQLSSELSGSTVMLMPELDPADYANDTFVVGWMVYKAPIPFLNTTQKALSFNTSFTFQLTNFDNNVDDSPEGMIFFVSRNGGSPSDVIEEYFGFAGNSDISPSANPFLAVEFDTYQDLPTDPSSSHVGIDISSFNSINITDTSDSKLYYPELYLYNNYTFKAWISYDASSQLIKVWMTNHSADFDEYSNPPQDSVLAPILQYKYDLSPVFVENDMFVGFSTATGVDSNMQLVVAIFSWYFSIEDNPPSVDEGNAKKNAIILGVSIPAGIIFLVIVTVTLNVTVFKFQCKNFNFNCNICT